MRWRGIVGVGFIVSCAGHAAEPLDGESEGDSSPPAAESQDAAARDAAAASSDATESGDTRGAEASAADDTGTSAPVDAGTDATDATDASGGDADAETRDANSVDANLLDASDAKAPSDATSPTDAKAPIDATPPTDANAPTDANTVADASFPTGWSKLAAKGLPVARVRAIAVDPTGILYAALYGVGVYRSADGGATFVKLGAPNVANDPPYTTVTTLALNALGEPVVGMAPPGSGTSKTLMARFDAKQNAWVTATVSHPINLGGYFPPAIRHDVDGALLSSWPFRNDIMRSLDNGSTWTNAFPIPNATHTPPLGPSASVKAVYGLASHSVSGELFAGTEGDQWWRSTDRGTSWSMIDQGGSSNLALEPGQNGFLIAFNKDGEPLIGTQGKSDGNFLMRVASDGAIAASNVGFSPWAMVGTASMSTVLRELVLTTEGQNFLAMPINNNLGGSLPAELYGSDDGITWTKKNAPFVPELNALATEGASVLVGGGAASPGVIWRYTPVVTNHLPRVSTGAKPGQSLDAPLAGITLNGSAVDPDGDALTFRWKARGPGLVTFANPEAASTQASFSVAGDYVLTLHASDGHRSAGTPVIVHVN